MNVQRCARCGVLFPRVITTLICPRCMMKQEAKR